MLNRFIQERWSLLKRYKAAIEPVLAMEVNMDPLLAAAAYSSTAATLARKRRKDEDAFYDQHGRQGIRRAYPAASAVVATLAFVLVSGLIIQ